MHFGKTTDIENNVASHDVKIYSNGDNVNILNAENCEIEIFDVLGRTVFTEKMRSNNQTISLQQTGIYIVKTIKNNILITEKVFIQ